MSRASVPMGLVWDVDALTGTFRYDVLSSESGGPWHSAGTAYWSAQQLSTSARLGAARRFRITVTDYARRTNPTQTSRSFTTRFVDDRSRAVRYKGSWERSPSRQAMHRGIRVSSARDASARLAFSGSAVAVVVQRNPHGGRARIYLDRQRVGVFSTSSRRPSSRRIIANFYFDTPGRHSIILRPSGGKPVRLDGFITVS
jgi:hypothetical protein